MVLGTCSPAGRSCAQCLSAQSTCSWPPRPPLQMASRIVSKAFGSVAGKPATVYTLTNAKGLSASVRGLLPTNRF